MLDGVVVGGGGVTAVKDGHTCWADLQLRPAWPAELAEIQMRLLHTHFSTCLSRYTSVNSYKYKRLKILVHPFEFFCTVWNHKQETINWSFYEVNISDNLFYYCIQLLTRAHLTIQTVCQLTSTPSIRVTLLFGCWTSLSTAETRKW